MLIENRQYFKFIFTFLLTSFTFFSIAQIPVKYIKNHDKAIITTIFSPDCKSLACLTADKTIKIYNTNSGELIKVLDDKGEGDATISFSPDSKYIAAGSWDKTVKIWDIEKGKILRRLIGHPQATRSVCFNSDGKLIVSAGWDDVIKIWYVPTGVNFKNFKGHTQCIRAIALNPNGTTMASGGYDQQLKVWDLSNGNIIFSIKAADFPIETLCYSPDGKYIATAGLENVIKIWDSNTGTLIKVLKGHSDAVFSTCFSPDGKYLVSGGNDNIVKIWDVEQGTCIYNLKGHSLGIRSVSFSSDGKYIVSGAIDKCLRVWDASVLKIIPLNNTPVISSIAKSEDLITWEQPISNSSVSFSRHVNIVAKINDPSLKNIQFFLNKTEYTKFNDNNAEIVKPLSVKVIYNKAIEVTYDVYLDNTENDIQIFAESPDQKIYVFSKPLNINYFDISDQVKNCDLRLCFINPNSYNDKKLNAVFEKDNAEKLKGIIKTQEGKAYNSVSILDEKLNSKLSKNNLLNTLDSLSIVSKKNDVLFLLVSGIFVKNKDNKIFLVTPDANFKNIDSSLVDINQLCKTLQNTNAFCGLIINASHHLSRYPDNYLQVDEQEFNTTLLKALTDKKDFALMVVNNPENTQFFDILASSFHPSNDTDNNNVIDFEEVNTFINQMNKFYYQYRGRYFPLFIHNPIN
jgi:WD40 repeat protein